MSRHVWLSLWRAALVVVLLVLAACGEDPPKEEPEPENPCGDACPIEECSFGQCITGNNGQNNGADMGDMGDATEQPDMEDLADTDAQEDVPQDSEEPDGSDVPDVEEDADVEQPTCAGDEDCEPGLICDMSGDTPLCREGCREDEDCGEGESCEPGTLVCVLGCSEDEDCGPEASSMVCQLDTRQCVQAQCRVSTQCQVGFYCDREVFPPVCAEGCDTGTCPQGEFCALDTRQCFAGCEDDLGCPDQGTWCDADSRSCLPGCREGGCPGDQVCLQVQGEEGPERVCAAPTCEDDLSCAQGQYCGADPVHGDRQICLAGCRVEPDSCPEGQFCEPEGRQCEDQLCQQDTDCDAGEICVEGEVSLCRPGCRVDEDCPGAQRCEPDVLVCVCDSREDCAEGEACVANQCVPACAIDEDCPVEGEVCNTTEGVCQVGCSSDEDCGFEQTAMLCNRRSRTCVLADCDADGDCPDAAYCDVEGEVCVIGCREGGCPEGEFCQLEQRGCLPGCVDDEGCAPDQFCDTSTSQCLQGCRGDEQCPSGQTCQGVTVGEVSTQRCLPARCLGDDDCQDAEYCGTLEEEINLTFCLPGCRTEPDNCPTDNSCDPEARQCLRSACGADTDCEDDEVCEEGRCLVGCRQDEQCSTGHSCQEGLRVCSCALDGDCQRGQLCQQGLCQDACEGDVECEQGQVCDLDSGRCMEGCQSDDVCNPGEICDLERGFCIGAACAQDSDCAEDRYCDTSGEAGRCAPGCRQDGCPQGQLCLLTRRSCAGSCGVDQDCPAGTYCDPEGACTEGCRGDGECAQGLECLTVLVDAQEVQRCVIPGCGNDLDCGAGEFCGFDAQAQRDLCQEGCRVSPDSCPEGQRCDVGSRSCVEDSCQGDGDCPEGRICQAGLGGLSCAVGCRQDAQCGEGQACVDGRCSCEVRADCAQGLACQGGVCLEPCSADSQCGDQEICDGELGSCRPGCRVNGDCAALGEHLACDREQLACLGIVCRDDSGCPDTTFCELGGEDGDRCAPGCREGSCPTGQFCDLEQRTCVRGCLENEDCLAGTYCDTEARTCVVGCRDNTECLGDTTCQPVVLNGEEVRRCLAPSCSNDDECEQGTYCGPALIGEGRQICILGCRVEPDSCPPMEVCDPASRLCVPDVCQVDADCGQGQICSNTLEGPRCAEGCREDAQCFDGGVCDPNLQRCLCEEDGQCFQGQRCLLGICEAPCTVAGCQEGLGCEPDSGACLPTCTEDADCDPENSAQRCDQDLMLCVLTPCQADEECGEPQYCELALESPVCAPGCRVGFCPEGQFCHPQQRLCLEGCAGDMDCPMGTFCGADDGQCRPGCRMDEECGPGLTCQEVVINGSLERQCLQPGCQVDEDCAQDHFCGVDPFSQEQLCFPGCRVEPDSCPEGLSCSPELRLCVRGEVCQSDDVCVEPGQICRDDLGGFCGAGCREDNACSPGHVCDEFANLCTCDVLEDCGDGQICDGFFCIEPCQENADCPVGLSCDTESGLCGFSCEEDEFEPNDDPGSASAAPGLELGGHLCNLEGLDLPDCYRFELEQGTYEVQLLFSHLEGDLNLEILDELFFPVAFLASVDDNESYSLNAQAGAYVMCVRPSGFLSNAYQLRLTQP